ncbi:MAG: hypothetical protein Q9160_008707 [Pyrenula sp. 1 TL-2023]
MPNPGVLKRPYENCRSYSPTRSNSTSDQSSKFALPWEDELGRLRVWAGNIGAHQRGQASLDYRLRDASHIKGQITSLLEDLQNLLQDAEEALSEPLKVAVEQDEPRKKGQTPINIDGEDDMESEEEQIFREIADVINCLFKMSMLIRRPARHDRVIGSQKADAVSFEPFDRDHVSHKFPKAGDHIIDRLGLAITRRRKDLKYRERHQAKLSKGVSDTHFDDTTEPKYLGKASTAMSPTIATAFEENHANVDDTLSNSGLSQTSYAPSIEGGGTISVPPPPDESIQERPFVCPYCYFVITIRSRRDWTRHVFKDIMPYSCVFPECHNASKLYDSRRDWFRHELNDHIEPFAGKRTTLDCPLCRLPDIPHFSLEQHLARHLEELALFAVPRNTLDESGSASNRSLIDADKRDPVSDSDTCLSGDNLDHRHGDDEDEDDHDQSQSHQITPHAGSFENIEWATVDFPSSSRQQHAESYKDESEGITWQRKFGVPRSESSLEGSEDKSKSLWTEISKDLVIREAIEEAGYEFEETDQFYYVMVSSKHEDVARLVSQSEDIRHSRRRRLEELRSPLADDRKVDQARRTQYQKKPGGPQGLSASVSQSEDLKPNFTPEEDEKLRDLKENGHMTWEQIADFFPGRTSGTLQVRYDTKFKRQKTVQTHDSACSSSLIPVEDTYRERQATLLETEKPANMEEYYYFSNSPTYVYPRSDSPPYDTTYMDVSPVASEYADNTRNAVIHEESIPYTRKPARTYCLYPECTSTFSRPADLARHLPLVHFPKLTDCPWPKCDRKGSHGFTRDDLLKEHRREVHHEDMPQRKKKSSRDDRRRSSHLLEHSGERTNSESSVDDRGKQERGDSDLQHMKGEAERNRQTRMAVSAMKQEPPSMRKEAAAVSPESPPSF